MRSRNIYDPIKYATGNKPFRVSRSKIDNFLKCPRCFYLDRRLGVGQPDGPAFTINILVDALLKREFDGYREKEKIHPIMEEHGIQGIPAQHEMLGEWRNNFKGVSYYDQPKNLEFFGAIDDLWLLHNGEYCVVDYKATATTKEISLDKGWGIFYKRQAEIYQWLLRNNGLNVSDTAYFLYCNGDYSQESFDRKIEFKVEMHEHIGSDDWIEDVTLNLWECLQEDTPPPPGEECNYCSYRSDSIAQLGDEGY